MGTGKVWESEATGVLQVPVDLECARSIRANIQQTSQLIPSLLGGIGCIMGGFASQGDLLDLLFCPRIAARAEAWVALAGVWAGHGSGARGGA